jgi:hypothetical protein
MDLGSGIRKKPIPDPGSRGQKGNGSRIRIRNTGSKFGKATNSILLCVAFHGKDAIFILVKGELLL